MSVIRTLHAKYFSKQMKTNFKNVGNNESFIEKNFVNDNKSDLLIANVQFLTPTISGLDPPGNRIPPLTGRIFLAGKTRADTPCLLPPSCLLQRRKQRLLTSPVTVALQATDIPQHSNPREICRN